MPKKHFVDRGDYTEEIIEWNGLSPKEESMANAVISSLYSKEVAIFQYPNEKSNALVRVTGDFWLNNNSEPFDTEEALEEWIEQEVKKAATLEIYCRFTEEKVKTIKK